MNLTHIDLEDFLQEIIEKFDKDELDPFKSVPKKQKSHNFSCFKVNSAFLDQQKLIRKTSNQQRDLKLSNFLKSPKKNVSTTQLKVQVIDAENIMKS